MRIILGILLGLLAAGLVLAVAGWVDLRFFPTVIDAASADSADPDMLRAAVAAMPLPARLTFLAGLFSASFAGAWLAMRVCDRRWTAWVVAWAVVAVGFSNLADLPYPLWMRLASVLLPVIGALLARRAHHKPYPGEALLG